MQAVVMAAGEGRRMRPLTERWAKPVLPIDGPPVIGTPLRDLAEAAVARALGEDPETPIGGGPVGLVGSAVACFLDPLPGNPPYELSSAFQLAIDSGAEIRGVEIGATRDLTSALDLVRENFSYLGVT